MIRLAILLLVVVLSHVAVAEVPANRLAVLGRGVNLVDVFQKSVTQVDAEIAGVQRSGLRHIRLFIDPAWVWKPDEPSHLDQVIAHARAAKLGVILCMNSYTRNFADDPQVITDWTRAWLLIANHYVDSDPDGVFFELVNEPPLKDVGRWAEIQESLRQMVRAIVPRHTLLLTSTPDSTALALTQLPVSRDNNVIYTFHIYQPMVFTHQGADWANPSFASIHDLQYPPQEPNLTIVERQASPERRDDVRNYGRFGRVIMSGEIVIAVIWGQNHNVPLMVTEFGVYRDAPLLSRAAWLRDVRTMLEKNKVGWSIWEYNAGFGIKPELDAGCGPIPAALGLCS
jgi:endoglucanase